MKVLILLFCLIALETLAANSRLEDRLSAGVHKGENLRGYCRVEAIYGKNPLLDFTQIRIHSNLCISEEYCTKFIGRENAIGGGGCTRFISDNDYEIHYSNGKNPQDSPSFCLPRYKPGGVRILFYGAAKKVEILAGDGSLLDSCLLK